MLDNRNPAILLGNERIPLFSCQDGSHPLIAAGFVWTCPICSEQWGKLEGTGNPKYHAWHIITWRCLKHTEQASSDFLRGGTILPYLTWHPQLFLFRNKETLIESLSGLLINYECSVRIHQILLKEEI